MDSNCNIHYEGTSVCYLKDDNGSMERANGMSFCCVLLNKNGFVLCSDSRETYEDGTFNEFRQKVFIAKDSSCIYGCTGCILCLGIDLIKRVNEWMDKPSLSIVQRLQQVALALGPIIEQKFLKTGKNQRFDMFCINTAEKTFYCLSIENGELVDSSYHTDFPAIHTMGVQVDLFRYFSKEEIAEDTIDELIRKGTVLVKKAAEYELIKKIPTVNENVNWVAINEHGQIQTNMLK